MAKSKTSKPRKAGSRAVIDQRAYSSLVVDGVKQAPSRAMPAISSWISTLVLTSMPTVGSSMTRMSVRAASHFAIETFC